MARKTSGSREQVEARQQAELAGDREVEQDEAEGEDEPDESLGEDVEGHDGGEAEAGQKSGLSLRLEALEGDEEEVDGERHPEGDEDVGDVEAGVEVGADAGGDGEGGVEAGAVGVSGGGDAAEEAVAERVDGEQQGENAEGEGEAGGPVVNAEDVHGAGGHPVHQGRLVEEADAVDVGGDEVVALEHLAGDLDVDGVDVVEQAGREEAAELEHEPGEEEESDGAGVPADRLGGFKGRCRLGSFEDHRAAYVSAVRL